MQNKSAKLSGYEAVIGLEVHAQLLTGSKIFCGCSTAYGAEPNAQTCPVCLGLPGALPVLNRKAVEYAMMFILAVGGQVNRRSVFARKNYFYPDLPKGYQISQYELPLGEGGQITITDRKEEKSISLIRIHLEDDAGKSFHPEHAADDPATTVDLNRCGVPLIEIVSRPNIRSPEEAELYLNKLRQILEYLGVCSGNMEEGALRCDANISVRTTGTTELGTRTELKNLNSFRAVKRALASEIERQIGLLKSGGAVVQQALSWDEKTQQARPMRIKEESADYRYFPEPDLPDLRIADEWIERTRETLPELPDRRRDRLVEQWHISHYDAGVLTADRKLADYFEQTVKLFPQGKKVANWMMTELLAVLKDRAETIDDSPMRPAELASLLEEIDTGTISGKIAKEVFSLMCATGEAPWEIIEKKGLRQISDSGHIGRVIEKVLAGHAAEVAQYRAGKTKVLGFLIGQVMAATGGKANPQMVNELIRQKLGE